MDIREQDHAYKRGLVLGITMAEIIILILFCLLLALAAVFEKQRARIDQQVETIARQAGQIAELEKTGRVTPDELRLVSVLKEYWERHAPKNTDFRGYFSQLVLHVEELAKLRTDLERLVEKNRALEGRTETSDAIAQRVRELEKKLAEAAAVEEILRKVGIDVKTPQGIERLRNLAGGPGKHDWPPIITLSGATTDYSFRKLSAELSDPFQQKLGMEIVPRLLEIITNYGVNVIEVIGHTDLQEIAQGRSSNLDLLLRRMLTEGTAITELTPADNAGLGLARALSVARFLSADRRLSKVSVIPLSAGQLVDDDRMTNWSRAGDVPALRRIEIRVRRSLLPVDAEARAGVH
jgi:flagellar motor protein MotB